MEESVTHQMAVCQRVVKKIENFQKMLSVRKDDLIEENSEMHSLMKQDVSFK